MSPSPSPSVHHFAAASITGNSEDILTCLLLYLLPKFLLRFQSVSKQWLLIIFSPNFSCLRSRFYPTKISSSSSSSGAAHPGAFVVVRDAVDRLYFASFSRECTSSTCNTVSNLNKFNCFQGGQFQNLHHRNGLLALVFRSKDYVHKDFFGITLLPVSVCIF